MSPMSVYTFDSTTIRQAAQHESSRPAPSGERLERWMGATAMAVVMLSSLGALLL